MSKEVSVSFHHDRAGRHPIRHTMLHRVEISDRLETPQAADSSIGVFAPDAATLTRDASGVTLRLSGGDEVLFPWPMIMEARNVPARPGK